MRRAASGFVVVLLVLAGCSSAPDRPEVAVEPPPAAEGPAATGAPPPVRVRGGGRELVLTAWSYCWSGQGARSCADGQPPASPPDIGSPGEIEVDFPVPGFRFVATATRFGQPCGRAHTATLASTGPTTYRLPPMGPAGDYVITLFGRGGGDLTVTFRWHTPRAGAAEAPHATASILAARGPEVGSHGVEVAVEDLRATPAPGRAVASARVTSSNGASTTIELERRALDCAPEGSVQFGAAQELGELAARLGPPPFRYDVTLVIDSVRYLGTATWPDDVDPECSPCTPLRFVPPLPGV